MSQFYLYNNKTKVRIENISQKEFINKLKSHPPLTEWFFWTVGLKNWKAVTLSSDVVEWISNEWEETQSPPLLPQSELGGDDITPKPPIAINDLTGHIIDFQDSQKDTHIGKGELKVTKNEIPTNTIKEHTQSTDISSLIHPSFLESDKSADPFDLPTTNTDTTASEKEKKHNRRYPRVNGRLRTIITNKSKAFMTFTKDVSLGGIQTENPLPKELLSSEIEVYLSDPTGKKSILFRCHPVGDLNNPNCFSFSKADEKNLQKLEQWISELSKINAAS